jgi:hypothetical protein
VDDAEAGIEGVAALDGDRLGETARGDGEAVEEADAAEQDETVAVSAGNEADLGAPLHELALLRVGRVQPQADFFAARDSHSAADRVARFAVVVVEVDTELVGQQVRGENRVGAGVDKAGEPQGVALLVAGAKSARTA